MSTRLTVLGRPWTQPWPTRVPAPATPCSPPPLRDIPGAGPEVSQPCSQPHCPPHRGTLGSGHPWPGQLLSPNPCSVPH